MQAVAVTTQIASGKPFGVTNGDYLTDSSLAISHFRPHGADAAEPIADGGTHARASAAD